MTLTRRTVLAGLAATAATPAFAQSGSGQGWTPNRPITVIHGFPPGGSVDSITRLVAESLSSRLGQGVVVEARPGAGGTLAASQVVRSAPDGYTLLSVPSGHAVSAAMYKKLPYQAVDDFSFITTTTDYPLVLVTYADHPARSMADFLKLGREQELLGGGPNGTLQHLSMELLARTAKLKVKLVPYRGSPQALTDMLGKRIDFMLDPPAAHLEPIKDGRLRALAVTGTSRFFALPDVPTMAEAGVPDFAVSSWQGLMGPAGLPGPIADRIAKETAAVLSDAAVVEKLKLLGNEAKASTPDAFKARVVSDIEKWNQVVAAANIERI